jgi:hypothetical protein
VNLAKKNWQSAMSQQLSTTLEQDWKRIADKNARLLFQLAGHFGESEIIPKSRLGLLAGIAPGKSKLDRPLEKAINLLHSLSLAEKWERMAEQFAFILWCGTSL